jgi:hypothetical protein
VAVDSDYCCEIKDKCANLMCPDHQITTGADNLCETTTCTMEADQGTCCKDRMSCGHGDVQCAVNQKMKFDNPSQELCVTDVCTEDEKAACCVDLGTCNGFDCTGNTVAKISPDLCADVTCTANECCEAKALCNTLSCSGTKDHTDGVDSMYCAGAACTLQSDEDMCCEEKGTCDFFASGDGILYCDSFSQSDCVAGLADQANLIACAAAECTAAECCTTAAGDPLPEERPAAVDADREVAQFGFVCEGISLHAMTDQMQTDFKM